MALSTKLAFVSIKAKHWPLMINTFKWNPPPQGPAQGIPSRSGHGE